MKLPDKENTTFRELFYDTDLIVIIDNQGKVMYYEDYNDNINMLKSQNVLGHSIFELYPYFRREDFTVFRAMDQKKPILNEYQNFQIDGKNKQTLNSAFPLISGSAVVGGIVISVELPRVPHKTKKNKLRAKYSFDTIITRNSIFKNNLDKLKKVSANDSSILIYGETGTGKELIAHAIHHASKRREAPLIIQNCASIPSSIMESLLFGTEKGSFTGAVDKEGIFEAAEGGTIFLDEINSMSIDLQSKILRTIENKTIRRIGETTERIIDVRIIAAANEDLLAGVKAGIFRADLYYRLNVVHFTIPPLRNRIDDIPLLSNFYLNHYNQMLGKNIPGITDDAIHVMQNYPWPGNVRELKNAIEYVVNFKDSGPISIADLPGHLLQPESQIKKSELQAIPALEGGLTLADQMAAFEKAIIEDAYQSCRYNVLKTADYLGIPRQTLYYKMKKYEIS